MCDIYKIVDFDVPMKLCRSNTKTVRELAIFCHAGWFKDSNFIYNNVPIAIYYYELDGDLLETDKAFSEALEKGAGNIPVKEIVMPGKTTNDYSLGPHEDNDNIQATWEAAATLEGVELPDLLLITGKINENNPPDVTSFYRLSDILQRVTSAYPNYNVCRFYGCRETK